MTWLEVDDMLRLHRSGMLRYGHSPQDEKEPGCIDACIGAAQSAVGYIAAEDPAREHDAVLAASLLLYYVALRHCFTDGNKRLSWAAAYATLRRAGLTVVASTMEAKSLVLGVISKEVGKEAVASWFAERVAVAAAKP